MENEKYTPANNVYDKNVKRHALWLAGVFEVGGYISFTADLKRAAKNIYLQSGPILSVEDEDLIKMECLQAYFFGRVHPSRNSFRWVISGRRAGWVIEQMAPYLPAHKIIAEGVKEWMLTDDVKEAYEIAKRYKGVGRNLNIPISSYNRLVVDSRFTGGISALRLSCGLREGEVEGNPSPYARLYSANRPLLRSVKNRFGGSEVVKKAGKTMIFDGREIISKNDSIQLNLVGNDARFFFKFC